MNGSGEEKIKVPETVGEYWKAVAAQARNDSITTFVSNIKKALITLGLTCVAAIIVYFLNDDTETGWVKLQWSIYMICALFLMLPVLYVYNFFRTPFILQTELIKDFNRIKEQLDEKSTDHKAEISKLQEENDGLQNRDTSKIIIRSELNKSLEGFQRIRNAAENSQNSAYGDFFRLDHPTYQYIQENVPGYRNYARGRNASSTYDHKPRPTEADFSWVARECDQRIEALTELIQMQS